MGFILIEKYHMNKHVISGTSYKTSILKKPDFPLKPHIIESI